MLSETVDELNKSKCSHGTYTLKEGDRQKIQADNTLCQKVLRCCMEKENQVKEMGSPGRVAILY